ncbi:SWIM zinc finger family protein [Patescibacteria group bacterium]|nr:SWIM zinc finger family protein [Patescibacteria group bacterium]MBU0964201.1 SWIM zinc finger family protein [Patescibacteria group bacterium]
MNSACDSLIERTYHQIWPRGEQYADLRKVKVKNCDDASIVASVVGTKRYNVELKFRGNGLSRSCDCPYMQSRSERTICKHLVAVAIVWDELRGFKRPSQQEVEQFTIPPPKVSQADVNSLFNNPLKANLETLRILADETALGGRSRPHARLPNMPNFNQDKNEPVTKKEIKKAFSEITRWSNRLNYDHYFCAGEIVAAFCEVMRLFKKRLTATPPAIAAETLREAQKFHYELIIEMIDDSEGLHQFTEAHLEDIYQALQNTIVAAKNQATFKEKLDEFNRHRDDY